MAKDGTVRGGARVGAGRRRKSVNEKYEAGNPGGRKLEIIDIPDNLSAVDLESEDMPPVKDYMSEIQRDGTVLCAPEIYRNTMTWLTKLGIAHLVSPVQVEQYSMYVARWIHCEQAISKYGYIAKHCTTNAPIQSPYVAMSINYAKQAQAAWGVIFQIVRENCTKDYSGPTPQDDAMEMLLRSRRG